MVTKEQAQTVGYFYHITATYSRGAAIRVRANGKCKTWKTRHDDFRLPVKYGLRDCFYITPSNAHEWFVYDYQATVKELGLDVTTPVGVVEDLAREKGLLV